MSKSIGSWMSLVALCLAAGTSSASHQQVPVVRLHTEMQIAAPASAIWPFLTQGKNLVTWCPLWKSDKNIPVRLTKVGDALDFTDQWGHGGRSVVTYFAADKELRIAHEPTDGSYMCQAKIQLAPKGPMTLVTYIDQYTDESSATDREATAKKVEADMDAMLAALKRGVEKK